MNIPAELKERPQWIVWRYVAKPGYDKPAKVPFTVAGEYARGALTENCVSYEEAYNAWADRPDFFSGLGFVFARGICGFDLDGVIRDPKPGDTLEKVIAEKRLTDYALTAVREANTAVEISVSGKGLHGICYGTLPEGYNHKFEDGTGVEAYSDGRYFTVAGKFNDNPLAPLPEFLRHRPGASRERAKQEEVDATESEISREDAITRCTERVMDMPESISGEVGHNALFAVGCEIARWGLDGDDAFAVISKYNDEKADPPWDEAALRRKIKEGHKRARNDGELGCRLTETGSIDDFDASEEEEEEEEEAGANESRPDDFPPKNQPSFPTEVFPPRFAKYGVDQAAAIGCDVSLVIGAMLAGAAQSIGAARVMQLKRSWQTRIIIWIVAIAESGTYKTPAWRAGIMPLKRIQNRLFAEYKELEDEWKAKKAAFKNGEGPDPGEKPIRRRVLISDCTTEQRLYLQSQNPEGLACSQDEISGMIKALNSYKGGRGSDKEKLLTTWDGDSDTTDRRNPEQQLIFAENTSLSIAGGVQPDVWRQLMTSEQNDSNGLDARFLLFLPDTREVEWVDDDIDENACDDVVEIFDRLRSLSRDMGMNGELLTSPMKFTDEAYSLWVKQYNAHRASMKQLESQAMKSAYSKLEMYAARFAALLELLWWAEGAGDSETVSLRSMENAIKLVEYFRIERHRVAEVLRESPDDQRVRELLDLIKKEVGGRITPRRLRAARRMYRPPGAAEAALDLLVKKKLGRWVIIKTSTKKATTFELNGDYQ